MEEKKRMKRFPSWLELIKVAIIAGMMMFTIYSFGNGALNVMGLIISMMAIWCVSEAYRLFEENGMDAFYEDEIDELESQINALDQECGELRDALKKATKTERIAKVESVEVTEQPKKTKKNRKPKKSDDR